jgi:putative PIN family toxin of toxin-antitoxin system
MRLVLDTNVWLDWLVFRDPGVAPLRAAVEAKKAEIVIDAPCLAELERVLTYRFSRNFLRSETQSANVAECRRVATMVEFDLQGPGLPRCADPDDQKFLELALGARAEWLVTKDRELLRLDRRRLPFRIVPPKELARHAA